VNFKTLRTLFHQLARDAVRLGPRGVLALPNTGTTQSHAEELAEAKRRAIAEENRPTSVVFWHRQSHARAFDAGGELVRPLYLHWSGERAHIASALASLLAGADVRLVPATHDEAAFVIEPLAVSTEASSTEVTPPMPDALTVAKRPAKRAATEGSAAAAPASFQVSRLKDTPETEAMLIDAVRTQDGASALDALQVPLRLGQAREEKLSPRHRKAGTLETFYAELATKPGPYPPGAVDALATSAARLAGAVTEGRESATSRPSSARPRDERPEVSVTEVLDASWSLRAPRDRPSVRPADARRGRGSPLRDRRFESSLRGIDPSL